MGMMILIPVAQAQPNCNDALNACDAALDAKNKALTLADLAITEATKQNGRLSTENDQLSKSAATWYHNPFILSILGVATGLVVGQLVIFKK